ncbi:MAG: hypothetical protein KDA85_03470 [Planctomycetaceae bacterium]|nr:hypothetical protein [Planctomycetaceae bacterium]
MIWLKHKFRCCSVFIAALVFLCSLANADESPGQTNGAKESPGTRDPRETLEPVIRSFHAAFSQSDRTVTLQAANAMLIRKEDIIALFGEEFADLGDLMELNREGYLLRIEIAMMKAPGKPLEPGYSEDTEYRLIDQRKEKQSMYRDVLPLIPPEVPVYRAVARGGSGAYLYVNSRWIWFPGFHSVVAVRNDLKEILPQARAQVARMKEERQKLKDALTDE